ncbi:MAG: hypothetical protein JWQ83_1703 [Lacunisphaera sp.]|nr:hypothetical protein [Lacunisphaera sp.]MDB6166563.1 hypothetical protein [Lacunisphaera sp.]
MALSLFTTLSAQEPTLRNDPNPAGPTPRTTADVKVSHSEKSFFEKAAKSGMKEVDVSQAVVGRLTNPQVKELAQSMITDHSAANMELIALAARKGVTLPTEIKAEKAGEKWAKKTDKDLDEDYLGELKEDHEEAVKLFEKAAKSDDPDIAAFAAKTLPTLQHHLEMVKSLKKSLK